MQWPTRLFVLNLLATSAACQFMSQLPLIIKSPYLHTWVSTNKASTTNGSWPSIWTGRSMGWTSWIRVDGITYQWMGQTSNTRPSVTTNQVTPTRTIFSYTVAGLVGFNATFLSPIDPTDLVQQSLPFGYFYVDVWSLDGKSHSVQIYTDVTGELLSSNAFDQVLWNTTQSGNIVYHRMRLSNMQPMLDDGEIAKDSTLFFAMENRPDMTWQIGPSEALPDGLRAQFIAGEPLTNSVDPNFRGINNNWPVLAFRVDLGEIIQTNEPFVVSLGLIRDPAIQYSSSASFQVRSSYYWSAYSAVDDIVKDVIGKFSDVRTKAINLDNKILSDGGSISSNYNDLISFALRLVFGAMDITIPRDSSGTLDTSDVKIFMKDIGVSSRASPVETIYAALPALLYVNASIVGLVLEPLLAFQNSSDYKNVYAAPDFGIAYPKVQGNTSNVPELALENCGNMLIMSLAHAMKSGDGSLIGRYYNLLKGWASYLEKNTLRPSGYLSADGESNPNLSNLALKGIVGMYAMSKISEAAGNADDAAHFQSQAQNYTTQWESLAITSGHISSVYGDATSWGLIYNLYAAKLLGQDSISSQTYDQQSQYYASQMGAAPTYGFSYDTNDAGKAKSHWGMFTAATVTDTSVRDFIIQSVWNRAALSDTNTFPTTYNPNTGSPISGAASPAHGAVFAQLALSIPNQDITGASTTSGTSRSSKINIGAIVGGVVGSLGGLLIIAGLAFFFWRRRRPQKIPQSPVLETQEYSVYEPFAPHLVDSFQASNPVLPGAEPVIIPSSKSSRTLASYPSSGNTSRGAGISFSPPSTGVGTTSSSGPSQDLRSEVEQLRREIEVLRTERVQEIEPPPLYDFARNNNTDGEGNIAGPVSTDVSGPFVPSRRK